MNQISGYDCLLKIVMRQKSLAIQDVVHLKTVEKLILLNGLEW